MYTISFVKHCVCSCHDCHDAFQDRTFRNFANHGIKRDMITSKTSLDIQLSFTYSELELLKTFTVISIYQKIHLGRERTFDSSVNNLLTSQFKKRLSIAHDVDKKSRVDFEEI